MTRDWLATLLDEKVEIVLPTLSLSVGDGIQLSGAGFIEWEADSGIRVRANTDGGKQLRARFGLAGAPGGHLLPRDQFFFLSGQSDDGWRVTTASVPLTGYTIDWDSAWALWDFSTPNICMVRTLPRQDHPRLLRALMAPPPTSWTRASETEVRNPMFGQGLWRVDWLEANPAFGAIAARQRSDHCFEVRVVFGNNEPTPDRVEALTAIANAFGFLLGRRVQILGIEDFNAGEESRHLFVPYFRPTTKALLTPLGSEFLNGAEELVKCASDFFLTDRGKRAAEHLSTYWDAADSQWAVQVVAASICLEGLLRLASPPTPSETQIVSDERAALIQMLNANRDKFSQTFIDRVGGAVSGFDARRPHDVLRDWERQGVLGVTRLDTEAWSKARNRAAHALVGSPSNDKEAQESLSRYFRVHDLINRVVLHLIGYQGQYFDYASTWAGREFPAASARSSPV